MKAKDWAKIAIETESVARCLNCQFPLPHYIKVCPQCGWHNHRHDCFVVSAPYDFECDFWEVHDKVTAGMTREQKLEALEQVIGSNEKIFDSFQRSQAIREGLRRKREARGLRRNETKETNNGKG